MNTYQKYVAYFENIATQHTAIQHSSANKRFFRINVEELTNGLRTQISERSKILVLVNYSFKTEDNKTHDLRKVMSFGFMVLDYVNDECFEEEATKMNECEQIIDDIIARSKYESKREVMDENSIWYGSMDNTDDWYVSPIRCQADTDYVGYLVTSEVQVPLDCKVDPNSWGDISAADLANKQLFES